jgi:UDP-N-acetylglucosamine--dolichyl-phosphate N-acetylglucosaminephosphotransferase
MESSLLITIFLTFFLTYLILPFWIRKAKEIGLSWKDMHKVGEEKVSGSGGIIVLGSVAIGILIYIAINVFVFNSNESLINIFALLSVLLIAGLVGVVDDFFGWQKGGLSRKSRIIMILFAAIPLMVINAGVSMINLPILGSVSLGILYPLLLIPLAVVAVTTTFNFLAGYNGLEASQGIIMLSALAIATYLTGNAWLSVILLFFVASLFGFYIFNKWPALVFPGDTLTYPIGAIIAATAILGNIEKFAIILFIPYIFEMILKSRGKLVKESFGKLNEDGSLDEPYDKIYGLEHLAIRILKKIKPSKKVYEKDVVYLINAFQIIFVILAFLTLI